jgi:NAD+ synthase
MDWEKIEQKLVAFLKDEVAKANLNSVVVGISGGLDSAVVAILAKVAFKDNMRGILMPSQFSSESSINDAKELCEKFDIEYEIVSIEPILSGYMPNLDNDKLRIGNFSARARMAVMYDKSAKYNALVVGTSNKSELLLGYGTIFGDIACAINPIGEIYKSDEYEFAKYLGVPESILNKKPSADLWEGQSDEAELGYTYAQMDEVLKLIFDKNKSKQEILDMGYDEKLYNMLIARNKANQFKGKLPIIAQI